MHQQLAVMTLILVAATTPPSPCAEPAPPIVWEGDAGPGLGKHIVFVAGDHEYRGEETLPALARILAKHYGFKCTFLVTTDPQTGDILPGSSHIEHLDTLETADLLVLFIRFQHFPDDQMQYIQDYLDAGKPVIGLRTSTHGFNGLQGKWARYNEGYQPPDGDSWRFGFGEEILGEHWVGHFGRNHQQSSRLVLEEDQVARDHPILRGVKDAHVMCGGYVGHPREGSVTLARGQVLDGMTPDSPPTTNPEQQTLHSVAWVRNYRADEPRSRVFATTHGASQDIVSDGFRRMLINAHLWCLGLEDAITADGLIDFVGDYNPTEFNFEGYRRHVKPADIEGWDTPIYAPMTIELPSVFSDHMVLQRDRPAPIWGRAGAGEEITVEFAGKSVGTRANAAGDWRTEIEPGPASAEPRRLTIRGKSQVVLEDVLVGEVWICSGQSNMEWVVRNSTGAEEAIAAAQLPRIRHFKAAHVLDNEPCFTVPGGWSVCSPETVGNFSAVGYYFGHELLEDLEVPIGLIGSSWGGSRAEPWTDPAALAAHPGWAESMARLREEIAAFRGSDAAERERRYQRALADLAGAYLAYWKQVTARDPGIEGGWAGADFDDSGWKEMSLPGLWEQAGLGLEEVDGLVWFRRRVEIPAEWAGKELRLQLGAIDDSDQTFLDGVAVGAVVAQHTAQRSYMIPADRATAGEHVIAVLVYDTGGAGGFSGPHQAMRLAPVGADAADGVSLAGAWRWEPGGPPQAARAPRAPSRDTEPGKEFASPGAMYNAMIHPFVPYGIRGAIWYQGEANAGQAEAYRELLPLMIESWRDAWGQGDFPFGIVQLASFRAPAPDQPVEGGWAELRDAQLHTALTVPATGLALATDIGAAGDIHPRNKLEVGRRLALWARATVYGDEELEYSGPLFREQERRDGELVLHFDHAAGLTTRDGKAPAGFAIAGEDGNFVWADARIEGDTVILSASEVGKPTAARHGWCNNLEHLNLVNGADLPAGPFRTD